MNTLPPLDHPAWERFLQFIYQDQEVDPEVIAAAQERVLDAVSKARESQPIPGFIRLPLAPKPGGVR